MWCKLNERLSVITTVISYQPVFKYSPKPVVFNYLQNSSCPVVLRFDCIHAK